MTLATLNLRSSNSKTGPIAVSRTEKSSCPPDCPLAKACYGKSGQWTNIHWNRVSHPDPEKRTGVDWETFLQQVAALPPDRAFRHDEVGDLPSKHGRIDKTAVDALADVSPLCSWTYTHHAAVGERQTEAIRESNRHAIASANERRLTVNVSTETLVDVDEAMDHGLPAVVTVASDHPTRSATPAGRTVIVCPEQTGKMANCDECRLCAQKRRNYAIAFRAHGRSKKHVPTET